MWIRSTSLLESKNAFEESHQTNWFSPLYELRVGQQTKVTGWFKLIIQHRPYLPTKHTLTHTFRCIHTTLFKINQMWCLNAGLKNKGYTILMLKNVCINVCTGSLRIYQWCDYIEQMYLFIHTCMHNCIPGVWVEIIYLPVVWPHKIELDIFIHTSAI